MIFPKKKGTYRKKTTSPISTRLYSHFFPQALGGWYLCLTQSRMLPPAATSMAFRRTLSTLSLQSSSDPETPSAPETSSQLGTAALAGTAAVTVSPEVPRVPTSSPPATRHTPRARHTRSRACGWRVLLHLSRRRPAVYVRPSKLFSVKTD